MLKKAYQKWQTERAERNRKRVIASLRAELAFWGIDTSDMSDEEIERRVVEAGKLLAKTGVSAAEAAAGLRNLATAVGKEGIL